MVVLEPSGPRRCPDCGSTTPPVYDPDRGPMMLAGIIPWPDGQPMPPPDYHGTRPKRTGLDVCPECGYESFFMYAQGSILPER